MRWAGAAHVAQRLTIEKVPSWPRLTAGPQSGSASVDRSKCRATLTNQTHNCRCAVSRYSGFCGWGLPLFVAQTAARPPRRYRDLGIRRLQVFLRSPRSMSPRVTAEIPSRIGACYDGFSRKVRTSNLFTSTTRRVLLAPISPARRLAPCTGQPSTRNAVHPLFCRATSRRRHQPRGPFRLVSGSTIASS